METAGRQVFLLLVVLNVILSYSMLYFVKSRVEYWAAEGTAYDKTSSVQVLLSVLMLGLFTFAHTLVFLGHGIGVIGYAAALNTFIVLIIICLIFERATGVSILTGRVVDKELAERVQARAKKGGVPVEPQLPQAPSLKSLFAQKPRAKPPTGRWTVRGILALVVATALGLLAYLISNPLIYLPALAALTLLATDYAYCFFSTGDIERIMIEREAPAYAEEDDLVEVKLDVYNPAGRINHVTILDRFAAENVACRTRKVAVGSLPGGKATTVSYNAICYQRGIFEIGPLEVRREFPLGLFKNRRLIEEYSTIKIYPHLYPNRGFRLVAGGTKERVGLNAIDKSGLSNDFFGVREYRPGDSRRLIHWKSTARQQKLMVKELEMPADMDLTAVIDLDNAAWSGNDKYNTFEYAVKIVGSVAQEVLEKGYGLRIVALGNERRELAVKGGRREFPRVLDFLVGINQTAARPIIETLKTLYKQGSNGSTLLLPLQVPDPNILETLLFLRRRGIETIVLLFDRSSFHFKEDKETLERSVFKSTYTDEMTLEKRIFRNTYILLKRNGFTVYPVNYAGGPMIYELKKEEAL